MNCKGFGRKLTKNFRVADKPVAMLTKHLQIHNWVITATLTH